jgi:predicted nucleotidyltransferase
MLRGFVQRIRKVNSSPNLLYTVTAAVVFGSAASDADEFGDVDVAVRLERKVTDWETHVELSYERVWRARRRDKRFRNITEQVFWPVIEIQNFLKSGTRQLSIHEFDELCRLPKVKCRILLGQRSALTKLLPNAEIVS